MAAKKKRKPPAPAGPPTIHEATLASGPTGAVIKGVAIDLATAIARRQAGLDIVVWGTNTKSHSLLARKIESAVGIPRPQAPHVEVGPNALPHFQPTTRPPKGHSFYETSNPQRKARKRNP